MSPNTLYAIAALVAATALDIVLMKLVRRYRPWRPQSSLNAAGTPSGIYVFGQYSPVLSWLKRLGVSRHDVALEVAGPLVMAMATPSNGPAREATRDLPADSSVANPSVGASDSAKEQDKPAEALAPVPSVQMPVLPAADGEALKPVNGSVSQEPGKPVSTGSTAGSSTARRDLGVAVVAFGLALIGQLYFSFIRDDILDGAGFFAAGIALFLIMVWRTEPAPVNVGVMVGWIYRARERMRNEPIRTALALLGLALAYTTLRLLRSTSEAASHWPIFGLWVASIVTYSAAFVRPARVHWQTWWQAHRPEVITIGVLTGVALTLRLVQLGQWPNVISGDEGAIGVMVLEVAKGNVPNMLSTVTGQSTLYLFIIAGILKLFGPSTFALRLAAALGGTLTIPAVYVLARRFFNARVALIAASLIAVSNFHLHFSRVIVAASIQDALFATVTLYFFLSGLHERSAGRLTLAAVTAGVALYIYMGIRLIVLMLPVYVLCLLLVNRKLFLENIGNMLAYVGSLVVTATPMISFALQHSDEFNARANQVGVIQSGWLANEVQNTGQSAVHILLDLLRQAFLTVNYYPSYGFHYSDMPMLDIVTGALFMLGLAYALFRAFDSRYLLLNGWFWSGIVVGGALVVLPAGSAYRIMIVFPAVCIFVGVAWDKLMAYVSAAFKVNNWVQTAPTLALIATFSFINLKAYFVDYAPTCRYEDENTRLASNIGSFTRDLGPGYAGYLLTAPRLLYGVYRSMDFFTNNLVFNQFLEPLTAAPTMPAPTGRAVFFFIPARTGELSYIQSWMPGGRVTLMQDCSFPPTTVYVVPGS